MFRDRRFGEVQLARDEQAADTVFDEISVALWREMSLGTLQPLQDLQPSMVARRLNGLYHGHFIN
jgi:hypothetical protein